MYTFTLTGVESILQATISPPIVLDNDAEYSLGLVNFETYNSIPNIDHSNNKFYVGNRIITIPEGSYELDDINRYLRFQLDNPRVNSKDSIFLNITGNNNTLLSEIKCTAQIDFTKSDSIGALLGFKPRILKADKHHTSDYPANILKVNAICIYCNLVSGSYRNNEEAHFIHQLFPNVPPGYKIVENPTNVVYLPINTKVIDSLTIKIVDQDGELVNFRGETVTVRLHLKRLQ